jgi:hypothetical protein
MKPARNIIGGLGNLMFKEAYIYSQMRDGVIPDLYLQDEKYFEKYADEIKARFSEGIGFSKYVGIHVRRGDYVGSDFHTDLTETDYYERAIELFPDKKFLVFSDDTEWCINHFDYKKHPDSVTPIRDERFLTVTEQNEIEDFNMLASCESIIMANSSFSWWAAYLCPNPTKRIIAPKEDTWFRDGIIRTKLPSTYEQI